MSDSGDHKNYPIVPPGEMRCIWMTAGILSYQLCDREFECDGCPLDTALRTRLTQKLPLSRREDRMDASSPRKQELNQEYRYGRKYTWVKKSDGGEMRVGIEPGFATALPVPRAVVLPPVGDRVHRNRACAWIVLDGGTLPVQAPLDGEVKSTNGQLLNHPHIIRSAPMDQGWLFDIVTNQESLDRAGLLGIEEAAKVFAAAESRFQSLVVAELAKGGATTGVTLPDGGQMLHNTSAMLGPARYVRLLREVYG